MFLQNPEDQPEFPVIERKYFVQFMFLADTSTTIKTDGHELGEDELAELAVLDTERTELPTIEGEMVSRIDEHKSNET